MIKKIKQILGIAISAADPDPVGSGLHGSPGSGSGKKPDSDPESTKRLL